MYRVLLLFMILLVSCDKDFTAPEPDRLIEQKAMEDILFDIKLLKAAKSKNYRILKDNNVQVDAYIYDKYKLDSVTLRQNMSYYATASFKKYKEIENNIKERFVALKEDVEAQTQEKENFKDNIDSF